MTRKTSASTHAAALTGKRAEFSAALLGWYRVNARRLPWRETPSLYRTVVSEFMLQQTQVKTVLPYFARWHDALPDFAALAATPEAQVLKLWEGLGYYSRARNLHRLARAIAALPAAPRTPAEWQELPGVGPYTAAAITSISFGAPAACVDGNVVRILARLTADATEYRDSATAAKAFKPLADALLSASAAGDHNQAMMELGATICSRQNPLCLTCPVRAFCAASARGEPEAFPRLAPKKSNTSPSPAFGVNATGPCCYTAPPPMPVVSPVSTSCPPPPNLASPKPLPPAACFSRPISAASRDF